MAEIDHIFASKAVPKAVLPISSASLPPDVKKSANKKRKRVAESQPDSTPPAPEIVIDSSTPVVHTKRPRVVKSAKGTTPNTSISPSKKKEYDAQAKFQDSRGSESRRKTEEGWAIYKEDELGIHDKGGDTPQCPFDCECCF